MGNDKIVLTPNDIYEKEFNIDVRGYNPQDVDKFLDMVIKDYSEFNSIIKKQEKEIRLLTEDNSKLKQELRRLHMTIEAADDAGESANRNVNNVDLLKRISNLEKVVYGKNE